MDLQSYLIMPIQVFISIFLSDFYSIFILEASQIRASVICIYLFRPSLGVNFSLISPKELLRCSNPKHSGYHHLLESHEGVKKVAEFVNEAKRDSENAQKLLDLQGNLVGKRARVNFSKIRKFFLFLKIIYNFFAANIGTIQKVFQ